MICRDCASVIVTRSRNKLANMIIYLVIIRHFSVAPYITICPSTETYFGLYLREAMSAVTGIYLFRLLLNIIFFALRSFFT